MCRPQFSRISDKERCRGCDFDGYRPPALRCGAQQCAAHPSTRYAALSSNCSEVNNECRCSFYGVACVRYDVRRDVRVDLPDATRLATTGCHLRPDLAVGSSTRVLISAIDASRLFLEGSNGQAPVGGHR
jgi:hypothetical protein